MKGRERLVETEASVARHVRVVVIAAVAMTVAVAVTAARLKAAATAARLKAAVTAARLKAAGSAEAHRVDLVDLPVRVAPVPSVAPRAPGALVARLRVRADSARAPRAEARASASRLVAMTTVQRPVRASRRAVAVEAFTAVAAIPSTKTTTTEAPGTSASRPAGLAPRSLLEPRRVAVRSSGPARS